PVDKAQGHICYDVIKEGSGEVLVFRGLDKMPYQKTDPNVAKFSLKTYVGLAVKLGPLPTGALCVVYKKDFVPTEEDKNLMKIIASAISIEEERQRAEEARIQSLEFYRSLIKTSPDAIFLHDLKGKIIMANERAASLFDLKHKDEFIGKSFFDLLMSKEKVKAREDLGKIKNKGYSLGQEYTMYKTTGEMFKADINTSIIKDIKGKPEAFIRVVRDVTERKKIEDSLRKSERFLYDIFMSIQDGISILDKNYNILQVNKTMERWYSYSLPLVGKKCYQAYHGRHKSCDICPTREALKSHKTSVEIIPKRDKDKKIIGWFELYAFPLLDWRTREVTGVIEYVRDITDSKKMEDILKKNEQEFRLTFEYSKDAIFWADPKTGILLRCNKAAEKLLERNRKEIIGKQYTILHPPEKRNYYLKYFKRHVATGNILNEEAEIITKSGKIKPVEITATVTPIGDKDIICGIFRDISDRKKVERDLLFSKSVFDNTKDAVFCMKANGDIFYVNPAASKLLGYSRKELLSMSICDIDISYPRKIWRSCWKNMQRQKIASLESRYRSKDGKIIPVEISANWTQAMGQAFTIAIVRDVTERERIEEVLRRSEQEKTVILSSVSEVVIYHDKEMRIVWANKAAEENIGLPLDKIIGQYCHVIWGKRHILSKLCPVKKAFTSGQPEIKELKSSDGKVWFIRGYPVKNKKGKVIGVVEVSSDITANRTIEEERQKGLEKFRRILEETVIALAATAERRDPYTAGHQRRVAQLACAIAEELGLGADAREGVRMAAIIHDVGKVYVPSEILSKPSLLTELEFNIIKTHPQIGYEILKPVEFPWPVAEIVLQHHEKINGSGYPAGITGKDILLEAKILVVADVVEAMASHRPYRAALGIGVALKEIAQNKGILYDPKVVDACFKVFRQKKFKFK
nr:PAS domain S-box protein [Candidatus Omnitrophota bacterium]